jgi:uncharacterized protein with HEPN domain
MERKIAHTIHDILQTMDRLEAKIAGKTFADFENHWELCFIVQRGIEIISEATRRIPDDAKAIRPEIDWRSVANIGNVLRHEYHTISNKVIWDVVMSDFRKLRAAIEGIAKHVNR